MVRLIAASCFTVSVSGEPASLVQLVVNSDGVLDTTGGGAGKAQDDCFTVGKMRTQKMAGKETTVSAKECQQKCKEKSNCAFFSWYRPQEKCLFHLTGATFKPPPKNADKWITGPSEGCDTTTTTTQQCVSTFTPPAPAPPPAPGPPQWNHERGACVGAKSTYGKNPVPEDDCRAKCRGDPKCIGYTFWHSGGTPNNCFVHAPGATSAPNGWTWRGNAGQMSIERGSGDSRAWCEFSGPAPAPPPPCTTSTVKEGRLRVDKVCLPEKISGEFPHNLPSRSPYINAVGAKDQNDVYISWTADRKIGRDSKDGRIYVSRLSISHEGAQLEENVPFDGFVKAGGIDVTENGVVGTLCIKYVPSWMKACTGKHQKNSPYGWVCPLAVAVCEVHRPNNCLQKRGTPWRIGKQYEPHGDGRVGVFGQDIAKTAGNGYLKYAPQTKRWTAWYGAGWGTHSGYAMHTYKHDAPRLNAETIHKFESGDNAGLGLLLPEDELQNRVEDFDPTDHHRRGTGDHQAGSAWSYSSSLGDIGLLKHAHGPVYMQQYGLQPVTEGAFAPSGKHSHGRLELVHNGDTAQQEGGLRPCGDSWLLALNTEKGGNTCAKVSKHGKIQAWRSIEGSKGGWRGNKMMRIAPLGTQEVTQCLDSSRFLFGYENAGGKPHVVEVDGNCNPIGDPQDVSAHTTWPIYEDWTTTKEGAVVWVTAWTAWKGGMVYYPPKPPAAKDYTTADSDGYHYTVTPDSTDAAQVTIYSAN